MSRPVPQHDGQDWLRPLVEASGAGTYECGAGGWCWSPQLRVIAGRSAHDSANDSTLLHITFPDDRRRVVEAQDSALRQEASPTYDIEYRILRPDGKIRWIRDTRHVYPDAGGQGTDRIVGLVQDISEHKQAAEALRNSEERFTSILMMAADWYWEQDENFRFVSISNSVLSLSGTAVVSHIGKCRWEQPHVGVTAEQWAEHRAMLEQHVSFRDFEYRRINDKGKAVWMSVSGDPIFDADGKFKGYRGTGRNIAEQKAWDETQRLLVSELNHRVKNTLATVQAIASNTLSRTRDPARFVETFSGRIQALASAHALLTSASWQGADLKQLITDQLALRGSGRDERIQSSGPDVHLEPHIALPMALVIHELGTNARKYGSLSVAEGKVAIEWRVEDNAGRPTLKFNWLESNGPKVSLPASRSFGSVLIERSLAFSLGGETTLSFEPAGLRCAISLPLDPMPHGLGLSVKPD